MNQVKLNSSAKSTSHMLPIKFAQAGKHILVHLISAEKLNMMWGFFRDSLKALPDGQVPEKIIDLKTWLKLNEQPVTSLPEIGFIFHISRCGSTLLSQNLKASQRFVVLGEAEFLGGIYGEQTCIPANLRATVAQRALKAWNQWAYSCNKQLICKLNSKKISRRKCLREDFPKSKMLFLYREPVSVTESLIRKPSGSIAKQCWLDDANSLVQENGEQGEKDSGLKVSPSGYVAQVYLFCLTEIKAAILCGHFACDYRHLSRDFSKIVDFFIDSKTGKTLIKSEAMDEKLEWNNHWSAKKGEWQSKTYLPVSEESMYTFRQNNLRLLEPLKAIYDEVVAMESNNASV